MPALAITGATGFLGRALVAECRSRRDIRLKVLVRNASVAADLWGREGVVVCEGDLRDADTLQRFLAAGDTVIHLAYLKEGRNENETAVRNLAGASLAAGVRRVVHCGTASVIGPRRRGVVSEATVPEPKGEYESTKLALEGLFQNLLVPRGELAILRPTEVIGPGGAGLRWMIDRLRTQPLSVNAAYRMLLGARRFNYVCVRNVVAALLLLAEAPLAANGEVFNVSDDDDPDNNYASVEELIRDALHLGRLSPTRLWLPLPVLSQLFRLLPDHAPPDRVYADSKIRQLGYRRVTRLRDTIQELVAFELGQAQPRPVTGAGVRA